MRILVRVGLVLAAVTVAAMVVVSLSAQEQVSTGENPARGAREKRFEVRITDEMRRHSRIGEVLYFVGAGWSVGVLWLLLRSGGSRRMREGAKWVVGRLRGEPRPFLIAMVYVVLFTLTMAVLEFPLTFYGGFVVPHQFDLTDQSFALWMADMLKGMAVAMAIGSVAGALALLAIRRVRRWWVVLWLASVPLTVLLVTLQPVLLDPLFNKFEPLRDQELRQQLLDLASRAGIERARVYQVDASKQTRTMNAYVTGIGPTHRIVMWDTLLAAMDHDEVLTVMGHEMGHSVLKHIWKTQAFLLVLSIVVFYLVYRLYEPAMRRWGGWWGVVERGDPASLPWLLLVASVISFLLTPVIGGYSRMNEHDADIFGLELTHKNESFATAFVKLAENAKEVPSPHPFIRFWLYTHPPIAERIAFALQYRPWEKGEPNRMWKKE